MVRALAERTAELHRALAVRTGDPAFDPEPLDGAFLAEWGSRIRDEIDKTLERVYLGADSWPEGARALAAAAVGTRDVLGAWVDARVAGGIAALRTRFHGDYHLGQVLVAKNDFVITDLEGEPAVTRIDPLLRYGPLKGPFRSIPAQPDWFKSTDPAELRAGNFSARWTGFIEAPAS